MVVGNHVVANVVANVAPVQGSPLLGQSFLSKLPGWAIDNAQHALVLKDETAPAAPSSPSPPQKTSPAPTPRAPILPAGASLQDLFTGGMMNVQVPFLESRVGVARRVLVDSGGEQVRTYTVEGCDVTAYIQHNEVVAYGLTLGGDEPWRRYKRKCNIELPASQALRTDNLTFGKFLKAMGVGIADQEDLFRASCLTLCGNAADPTVRFHWDGPHAVGFLKIELTGIIAYGRSIDAAKQWQNLMTKAEGRLCFKHSI
jgi:hypothetical protein